MKLHRFESYLKEDIEIKVPLPELTLDTDINTYIVDFEKTLNSIKPNVLLHIAEQLSVFLQQYGFEVSKIEYEDDRFFMLLEKKMTYVLEVRKGGNLIVHFVENLSNDPTFREDITYFDSMDHQTYSGPSIKRIFTWLKEVDAKEKVFLTAGVSKRVELKLEDFISDEAFEEAFLVYMVENRPQRSGHEIYKPVWIGGKKKKVIYLDGEVYIENV